MAVYLGKNKVCNHGGTKVVSGSLSLQDKTITPATYQQTVQADGGYDGLGNVTVNAIPTTSQSTPTITVSDSGLITASSSQTEGYVTAGTKSSTKQLTTKTSSTITPGTSSKTIASGTYLTGTQTIKGDTNLVAGNIRSGVSIFGVAGSYSGSGSSTGTSGTDTSDATVTSTDIRKGKIAYGASGKIIGDMGEAQQVTNIVGQYNNNPATVSWRAGSGSGLSKTNDAVQLQWTTGEKYDTYVGANIPVIALAEPSSFGDVTAEKVLSGWTFTSKAGVKVKGTMNTKSLTADATATAEDIASGKTAYVNGVKLIGTATSGGSGGSGMVIKTGTTTSKTINTGLSSISTIMIYATGSVSSAGFIHGFYVNSEGKFYYSSCSSYSTYFKNYSVTSSTQCTISNGTFTMSSSIDLASGVTYSWTAYGNA